jgi:hypothetical protein
MTRTALFSFEKISQILNYIFKKQKKKAKEVNSLKETKKKGVFFSAIFSGIN